MIKTAMDRVTPNLMLAASQKLLGLQRGEEEPDDRDSLSNQQFYGPEDFFRERIERDAGGLAKKILWNSTNRGKLSSIGSGALTPQLRSVIMHSGLAMPIEEINPLDYIDQQYRVTRLGEGGISSTDSIPDESRAVHPSQFGFIDPVRGPECYDDKTEVLTSKGWLPWPQVTNETYLACLLPDNTTAFSLPERLIEDQHYGAMYGVDTGDVSYLVTPGHRVILSDVGEGYSERGEVTADIAHGRSFTLWGLDDSAVPVEYEVSPDHHYIKVYSGVVYCATVPGGMLYVRRGTKHGIWSGNSEKLGIDTRVAMNTYKGSDGNIYSDFTNVRTGKTEKVSARRAADMVMAFPGEMAKPGKKVRAMVRGKLEYVDKKEVDYELPHASEMYNLQVNLIPMHSATQGNRMLTGSKMQIQAMALRDRDTPLVQSETKHKGISFEELVGRRVGAVYPEQPGTVTKVDAGGVTVKHADGTSKTYELYNSMPLNRKSYLHNTATVKRGDIVDPSKPLATSNYTDANGALAIGRNLRVAFMPYAGINFEDATVISESAAKALASEHMYTPSLEQEEGLNVGYKKFTAYYPKKYDKRQLDNIDPETGLIRVGSKITKEDPLILAVGKARSKLEGQWGELSKSSGRDNLDRSVVWDHDFEGEVTDVVQTPKGAVVAVRSFVPVQEGDKLSARHAAKGVVGKILPDDQMPHDKDGKPYDVLQSPLTVPTRLNPAQIIELALAKVARKTGKVYKMPQFMDESFVDYALAELKKHGLSDTEEVMDPVENRKIPDVLTGEQYFMRLHHTAEGKASSRSTEGYSSEDAPTKGGKSGAKQIANLALNALLSHNAKEVIADTRLIRGQRNDDFWRRFKLGQPLPSPKVPTVYKKMVSYMNGAGINIKKVGDTEHLLAMTDKDVDALGAQEITSTHTVDSKSLQPVAGGLFDRSATGGHGGNKWGFVKLNEPLPNPVMEEPIRRILGLTQKKFESVIRGDTPLYEQTGGQAILAALQRVRVDDSIEAAKAEIRGGVASKRDDAVKRLRYLSTMKKFGMKPHDLVITKVPVIPPMFRPISSLGNGTQVSADANYLYQDLMENNNALKETTAELGRENAKEERWNTYQAYKAVTGVADPVHPKLQEKGIGGLLKHVFGKGSPKHGAFQRRVIGMSIDLSGRSAVTPNPSLDMDQVGLPEEQAWEMYSPFVIRRLVRKGMPATRAVEMIETRDKTAMAELQEEMSQRPLLVSRAPTLHKYGLMAFMPKLIKGKTLQTSPVIAKGFNLDYDGNCCDSDTEINLTISESELKSTPAGREWFSALSGGIDMGFDSDTRVDVADGECVVSLRIKDVPRIGVPMKDKHGADVFDVPPGVYIVSYDHTTARSVKAPVTKLTRELECPSVKVVTARKREVIVSANESMAVFDPETGELVKMTPQDSVGKLVPVVKRDATYGDKYSYRIGWWYGALLADGWMTGGRTIGYAKLDPARREEFVQIARRDICENFTAYEYCDEKNDQKFSKSAKVHLNGKDLVASVFDLYGKTGTKGALHKEIPGELLGGGSFDCLLGLFAGLLDGDSTLGWNYAKGKPQFVLRFNTSSSGLVRTLGVLLRKLGLRYSVTTNPARGQSAESYTVCPSLVDTHALLLRHPIKLVGGQEQQALEEFMKTGVSRDSTDYVAVEAGFVKEAMALCYAKQHKSMYTVLSKAKNTGRINREALRTLFSMLSKEELAGLPSSDKVVLRVADDSVFWDVVKTVEDVGNREVYDFEIPDTKVFALNNGLVVYDTMSYTVPVTEKAVAEAKAKMLPSANLLNASRFDVHYKPSNEYQLGLYQASTRTSKRPPQTFRSKADVMAAYKRGELRVGDPVVILEDKK